jgi:hypothetical protein
MAQMSPAPLLVMSSIWLECMRTRRGTLIFFPFFTLVTT